MLTGYQNTFSKLLGVFGLDVFRMLVPDILHEFELGLWKAVFSHLIRMLYSIDEALVRELDRRYVNIHVIVLIELTHTDEKVSIGLNVRAKYYTPFRK